MKKVKAIELLQKQLEYIGSIKDCGPTSSKYLIWKQETHSIIKTILGEESIYYQKFAEIKVHSRNIGLGYAGMTPPTNKFPVYNKGLKEYEALLHGMIKEIELRDDEGFDKLRDSIAIVQIICNHFHQAVRQMRNRHDNRSTIDVNDEYDVQDLLHAFLRLHFDDVRAEEWAPSYAGSASRMDFLLKKEKVVIEVKKTRKNLGAKEVGEQLMIDIERYTAHPDCETLICFVYDPEGRVANPVGIENDLNRDTDNLKVITIITPK